MQKVDEVPSSEENIMNSKLLLITSKSRKFKFDSIILDFKHEIKNYIWDCRFPKTQKVTKEKKSQTDKQI